MHSLLLLAVKRTNYLPYHFLSNKLCQSKKAYYPCHPYPLINQDFGSITFYPVVPDHLDMDPTVNMIAFNRCVVSRIVLIRGRLHIFRVFWEGIFRVRYSSQDLINQGHIVPPPPPPYGQQLDTPLELKKPK